LWKPRKKRSPRRLPRLKLPKLKLERTPSEREGNCDGSSSQR
jgi:hypothetical protein